MSGDEKYQTSNQVQEEPQRYRDKYPRKQKKNTMPYIGMIVVICLLVICAFRYISYSHKNKSLNDEKSEEKTVKQVHKENNANDKKTKKTLQPGEQYKKAKITYDFQYTTVVVDYDTFKDWIILSDDKKNVMISDTKIDEFITKLCTDFNTWGHAREFKTATGETIQITEGDYGWKINYKEELAKLEENIKNGEIIKREPIYSYRGKVRKSATDDIGKNYVEVSIADQKIYLYVDGKQIVNSPVVTGDITQGDDSTTHSGIYAITYKQRNATLVGEDYESAVSFWMPFNENEGIHDAPWRSSFGGDLYKGHGSHGCVNCPPDVAKTIYKYVDTGFPVIIY